MLNNLVYSVPSGFSCLRSVGKYDRSVHHTLDPIFTPVILARDDNLKKFAEVMMILSTLMLSVSCFRMLLRIDECLSISVRSSELVCSL